MFEGFEREINGFFSMFDRLVGLQATFSVVWSVVVGILALWRLNIFYGTVKM